jgi:alkanesulfonate monooxygenase SsuD/methylene tetrahydromethanopterin reductase-like flavin-dependent oxidoreductase (luciferase family)
MNHLWYDEHPGFHGSFADFAGIDAYPRPVQRPIPVLLGGHSRPAFRRAVARGHGWYGFGLTPEKAAECIAGLRAAARYVDRPAALGELEISVTPQGVLTREKAAAFARHGVDRLVPVPPPTPEGAAETIATATAAVADLA